MLGWTLEYMMGALLYAAMVGARLPGVDGVFATNLDVDGKAKA